MEAEHSALYWQYAAASLGRIVTVLNVVSALIGASAVALLITDYPILTKVIALIAAGLTLFVSYSGVQQRYEPKSRYRRFAEESLHKLSSLVALEKKTFSRTSSRKPSLS
jgi:hypothetical protein